MTQTQNEKKSLLTYPNFFISFFLCFFAQFLVFLFHDSANLAIGSLPCVILFYPDKGLCSAVALPVSIEGTNDLQANADRLITSKHVFDLYFHHEYSTLLEVDSKYKTRLIWLTLPRMDWCNAVNSLGSQQFLILTLRTTI